MQLHRKQSPNIKKSIQRIAAGGILFILLFVGFVQRISAAVQKSTVDDLIYYVNSLRAINGLTPYTVDYTLMGMAQAHSEYLAANHICTHIHSDGSIPVDLGIVENIASGEIDYITPYDAVYSVWSDWVHMKTMTGYASGSIGAGIAYDDTSEYYVVDVRPANELKSTESAQGTTSTTPFVTIPVVPLVTSTSQADGSIIHLVGYGQTLWSISQAYNVSVDQLRAWNNLSSDSNDIYAGQYLLVLPVELVTVSPLPELTNTSLVPTSTRQINSPVPHASDTVIIEETSLNPTPSVTRLVKETSTNLPVWGGGLIFLAGLLLVAIFLRRKDRK